MNDKIQYFPEHKNLYTANVVETCEGEGTKESPKRIVYYIYHTSGVLLGKIDTIRYKE